MTEKEKQFNQWFDEYADGVKVFEEADMKQAYLQGRADLEKENAKLKKNYEDSLVACGVLKNKIDLLAQPSPLESMQDTLITAQKMANEKQKKRLTEATEIIKKLKALYFTPVLTKDDIKRQDEILAEVEQFISEVEK